MPGVLPSGEKVYTLAGTTETIDLSKTGNVFIGTVTAACILTFTNSKQGYSELTFILTNPHTNFDILACLWVGGSKGFTQTGVDWLKIGIYRTGDTVAIYEIGQSLDVKAD